MKKLGLFALIAVLFTACSQDNTTDNALQPELLHVGFEEGTRVQLNDQHQTVWNTGDMVSVFYKSDANSCYSYTGDDKARTGVISKVDNVATTSASLDKVYAVYPYNADYTIDAQGVVSATVSANQTYAAGSYGIGNNIMVATGGSAELRFQNVYGWVRLQFTGKDSVSKLVFRGNNNEVLAGAATINPNDATIAFAAGGATELTLDCSNVTLTDAATEFYIAVAPQAFEKGFEVEAHTAAGVKVFNKGTATTITRNVVTTMATTEIDVITPISDVTTAGTYTVTGTVVAVGTKAYIIADNTGAMMVYHYNNGRTVGENITISGEVTIYQKADGTSWGTPQFSNAATVVVNSTNNAWTYNPSVLDAAGVDAMLTETLSKEVEFAGKLVVSGNYINIEIAGATVQGSVKYVDNNAYADLNGKDVTVKGYFVGVSSKKYVNVLPYSIEAKESVNPEPEPEPEPTPDSNGIVWEIGLDLQSWNTDTNATYGAGFIASDDNISVGYYQHKSTSKAVEPKTDHIRIYKSSALVITPLNGKTIKKVVIDVTYASTYALDMNVLSDGTTAVGDTTAGTITWSGSTDQFVAEANNGQVRVKKLTVITE